MEAWFCTKKIKQISIMAFAGIIALSCMGACGKKGLSFNQGSTSPNDEAKSQSDSYVYVPDYIELKGMDNAVLSDVRIIGDSLYYAKAEPTEGGDSVKRYLCEYSLSKGEIARKIPLSEESGFTYDFTVAEDGRVYVLDYPMSGDSTLLLVFDRDGALWMQLSTVQALGQRMARKIAVDSQNRIYIALDGEEIALIDADGGLFGTMSLDNGIVQSIGIGKDRKVYVVYDRNDFKSNNLGLQLSEIHFKEKKLDEKVYKNYPNTMSGNLVSGENYDFLVNDGKSLWGYSLDTESSEKLFDWSDCGVDVNPMGAFSQEKADQIQVLTQSGMGRDAAELTVLKKTEASLLPQKTELVLSAMEVSEDLRAAVVAFNRQSRTCHITIRNYQYEKADGSWISDSEAIQNMNMDIISEDNCPDIFDLRNLNVEALVANDVFEDLEPWLEQSSILNREDYLENVLESYTYGDVLTAIPVTVTLSTLMGRTDMVGEEVGWTVDEMMSAWEKKPGISLFSGCYNQYVLRQCLQFGKREFIDWNAGKANFDCDNFKKILVFAGQFPSPEKAVFENGGDCKAMQRGELLLSNVHIQTFWDVQLYDALYGGVTFIGYPVYDQGNGCMLQTSNACAMASKCKNKQAAWEFIEFLLEGDLSWKWAADGFPCNKNDLKEKISVVEYVRDSNGDLLLDLNGNPTLRYQSVQYNGEHYEYHAVTENEAALTMDLLESAQFVSSDDMEISRIIYEEADAFFQNQKTADQVAAIIQNRVQLYMEEE